MEEIKCPCCEVNIDGDYWFCSVCNDTEKILKSEAELLLRDRIFFENLLFLNKNVGI